MGLDLCSKISGLKATQPLADNEFLFCKRKRKTRMKWKRMIRYCVAQRE